MDEREQVDPKPLDQVRELNSLQGVMTPPQSLDESPSMLNRRRARPFSMLSYNNHSILPQTSASPSPLYPDAHSRNASFSSAPRSLAHPALATPSKRPSTRWTVIIIPPALLPHSPPPPHVSGFAHGYGASGRYSAGLLLPLQPTLTLQLAAIAREFSLPSTGGLSLHLSISSIDQPPIPGPRVTDESWNVLFGWAFEDNPPACSGLQASTGLPIAGRLEFDIDLKKARWFDAWAAASQPSNRASSQAQQSLKLTSASLPPGLARGSEQLLSSSSAPGVRTLIISTRRNSSKSIETDDGSRDHPRHPPNGQLDNGEYQSRSPTSIKSAQASPSRYVSANHESRMTSPITITSAETYHRQHLERLIESEELSATEEDNWHLQQETMLRQATMEREQIELADQLEDERRIREEQRMSFQAQEQYAEDLSGPSEGSSSKSLAPLAGIEESDQESTHSSRLTKENPTAELKEPIDPPNVDEPKSYSYTDDRARSITPVNNKPVREMKSLDTTPVPQRKSHESPATVSNQSENPVEVAIFSFDLIKADTTLARGDSFAPTEVTATHEISASGTRMVKGDLDGPMQVIVDQSTPKTKMNGQNLNSPRRFITTSESIKAETLIARCASTDPVEIESSEKRHDRNTLPDVVTVSGPTTTNPPWAKSSSGAGDSSSNTNELFKPNIMSKHLSEPARERKPSEAGGSTFSPTLGRSVNRFSGEQELIKRRLKTAQGDEETQKLIDEMNRIVNEKAMAKEAMILSNPSLRSVRGDDDRAVPSPVKETQKVPPPPPTRSKVIQLAKTFGSSDPSPPTSAKSSQASIPSPKDSAHTLDSSPSIPPVSLPPSTAEPALEFLAHPPVIQGASTSHPTLPLNGQRSTEATTMPSPAGTNSKSTPVSSTSSPASRSSSLFKPRLSIGNNLLSSIFRSQTTSAAVEPEPAVIDPLAPVLNCYTNPAGMSDDLGDYIISAQDQAIERHRKFIVAISGSSLPTLIASGLIDNPKVKWDTWKVFFTDERIVPLDHEDSNFANSMAALFGKVPIDRSQLVSIMGLPPDDIDLDEMAPVVSSIYMAQILEELDWSADGDQLPRFDLILLGMGEDGHTCSLFPSHKLLDDQAIISWCNDAPHPPTHRITMTLSVLNAAHELAFVCAGSSIEDTLAAVLDQDPSPTRPASLVKLGHKSVVWFVDQAAAAKTQYPRTTRRSTLSSDTPEASNEYSAPQSDLPAPQGDLPAAQSDLPAAQSDHSDAPSELSTPKNSSERASLDGLQLEGVHLDSNASVANNELSPAKHRGIGDDQPIIEPPPLAAAPLEASNPAQSVRRIPQEQVSQSSLEPSKLGGRIVDVMRLGYPYNLRVYPPVYPHIDELLNCPALPVMESDLLPKESHLTLSPSTTQEVFDEVDEEDTLVQPQHQVTCHEKEVESEKVRDLDETSDLGPVKTLQPTPLVDPRIELPQQPPHDLDPTLVLDEGDDCEGPQSTVPPTISASRADQGYPCNLSVYPPVYPHLQDMFQAPLSLNHSNEPAPVVKLSLPTPDSLSPDVVQKLADARVIEVPEPEQAPTSDVDAGGPIGYPYNLIIYPAIYPHVQDFVYSQLPPSFPACDEASEAVQPTRQAKRTPAPFPPFSAEVNRSHGIAYQVSPGLEAGPISLTTDKTTGSIVDPKSPVAAMRSTLSPAFYSPSKASYLPTSPRIFTPSLQYTQLESQPKDSLTPAGSPLALRALPTTLPQQYHAGAHASDSEPENSEIRLKGLSSPVAIIPSNLPDSFYPADPHQYSPARRIISPSLPFTHSVSAKEGPTPAIPAAALKAPSSALSSGFFGSAGKASSTAESTAENVDQNIVEDLPKREEENRHQAAETDQQSDGSYSHLSMNNSSMHSQTTLRQLTDDDWPPTPPSPDRLPSPDLMSRLATTPMAAHHANGSSNVNMIKPQFPDFKSCAAPVGDQSSSSLIESDQDVHMTSMAEASLVTPSVEQFHDRPAADISDQSGFHPEDPSEFHAGSTPRASAEAQLEPSYVLSTSPENLDENSSDCSTLLISDSHAQLDSSPPTSTNGLGLELGEIESKLDGHAIPSNQRMSRSCSVNANQRQLSTVELSAGEGLMQSSGSSECQINPLHLLGERDVDDMGSEISPPRLASPTLMERLVLTPCASPTFPKQFPTYQAALTANDEPSFLSPPQIEADWNFPQVSLSQASIASPSRPSSLSITPTCAHEFTGGQPGQSRPTSSVEAPTPTQVIPPDEQLSITQEPVEQPRSDSPLSQTHSSLVHAITVNSAIRVEQGLPSSELVGSYSSHFNSPILPPLSLNVDLSDPLSAATTARSGTDNDTPRSVQQSPSDERSFEQPSNGLSLDGSHEMTRETPVTADSPEMDTGIELNLAESLPSITKRPPTPTNNDLEVSLESVTIDDNIPPPPSPILLPFEDLTEISEALGQFVFEAQEVAIQRHGKFRLALGGSILPQILGEGLVGDDRIRWESWEIFLVEEAIAPMGSPESVLSAITESILQHVPIPRNQVHSIAELTQADIQETQAIPEGLDSLADSLADEYENRLIELFPDASHETGQPPEFDLILISIGEEGQVGSLYPSHPMLGEANWFVAWLGDAWEPPSHRITLTLPVLNAAHQFAFLAVGQEVAEIVADGLDRSIQSDVPMEEDRVNPAALVKSSNLKPVVWFTDTAAASLTDYPKSAFWDEQ
ncbi:hypothetical protein PCANC_12532 [Puccinia coronata f. sp. avenae]|uniref:6-phosphogluconolactonase n=1 Tax=Puccinia coronata f. sp. avenae TaxID=200324 RepID=A0A2N5VG09_9BASI|nr:hypothetical protein PCANC_12532 [Puccinia coronata f. sp. avenae]PLW48912.1 hypothetical protein PCASD_02764 [Puccinia coronata f. sp. avenae]